MKKGWLVNDRLTCIPGTRTFWHNLLDWFPNLTDMTNTYTDFQSLAGRIESQFNAASEKPNFIIRNATFFRQMNIPVPTISFLQDIYEGTSRDQQAQVISSSHYTVFNSPYTMSRYKYLIDPNKTHIIPIGTDFEMFHEMDKAACAQEMGIVPGSLLFVGASTNHPKGFDLLLDLVESTNENFVFVMKDSYKTTNPRIKVFNQIEQNSLAKVYNACEMLLCTSREETLHLSSVEAGACGLPVITPNIGIHYNENFNQGIHMSPWGATVERDRMSYIKAISEIRRMCTHLNTRKAVSDYSIDSCRIQWQDLLYKVEEKNL